MLGEMTSAFQIEIIFGGLFCLFWVALFVIFLLIAIWVYRDAESRGMSGALWLIIVLLFSVIGLIIYLVVRHDRVQPMMPPQQPWGAPPGAMPPPGMPPTGAPPGAQMTCRNCGSPLAPGATFCGKCGAKV